MAIYKPGLTISSGAWNFSTITANSLDRASAGTFQLGATNATEVRISRSGQITSILDDLRVGGTTPGTPLGRISYQSPISSDAAFFHHVITGAVNFGIGVDSADFLTFGTLSGVDTWATKGATMTNVGNWSFGPPVGTGTSNLTHNFRADGGCVVVLNSSSDTTAFTQLAFQRRSVTSGYIGASGTGGGVLIAGAAADDFCIVSQSPTPGKILFSANGGSNIQGSLYASGAWTFGPSGHTGTHSAICRILEVKAGDTGNANVALGNTTGTKWYLTNNAASSDDFEIYNDDPAVILKGTQAGAWTFGDSANLIDNQMKVVGNVYGSYRLGIGGGDVSSFGQAASIALGDGSSTSSAQFVICNGYTSSGAARGSLFFLGTPQNSFGSPTREHGFVDSFSSWVLGRPSGGSAHTLRSDGTPLTINSTNNTLNKIAFEDSGSTTGYIGKNSSFFYFRDGSNNTKMYFSTPFGATSSGGISLLINSAGFLGTTTSLRETKGNINELADTNWLHNLNPVTFQYKKCEDGFNYTEELEDQINYGLIAEEVVGVNPLLTFSVDDKLRGVEYIRLIVPMLKEIQKLRKELNELKS